jgi:hypothetical protein
MLADKFGFDAGWKVRSVVVLTVLPLQVAFSRFELGLSPSHGQSRSKGSSWWHQESIARKPGGARAAGWKREEGGERGKAEKCMRNSLEISVV